MSKSGRNSRYSQKKTLALIEKYAALGLTQRQIAYNLGIHPNTFSKWKRKHYEIETALDKGRATAIRKIENAMMRRALGYDKSVVSEIEKTITDTDGSEKTIVWKKKSTRHIAPNIHAATALLNRLRDDDYSHIRMGDRDGEWTDENTLCESFQSETPPQESQSQESRPQESRIQEPQTKDSQTSSDSHPAIFSPYDETITDPTIIEKYFSLNKNIQHSIDSDNFSLEKNSP